MKRYQIFIGGPETWVCVGGFLFKKRAICNANILACEQPQYMVQVLDTWRRSKMVHCIKADINAMRKHKGDKNLVPCIIYG